MQSHFLLFAFVSLSCGDRSKNIFLFFSRSFIISGFTSMSLVHFELNFIYHVRKQSSFIVLHVAIQFSKHRLLKMLSFPHCILFPSLLQIIDHVSMGLFLGSLFHSVDLCLCFCTSAILLDYYSSVVQFEIREHDTSNFVLLSQDYFCSLGCFVFPYIFQNYSSSVKTPIGILIGVEFSLQIVLGSVVILTILIPLIHEHIISFHFFVLSSNSFINILQFSEYKTVTSLVRLIPRYFSPFDAVINEIVFLISLSDSL